MGNKGAFITLSTDLKPQFTTYEAVVSQLHHHYIIHNDTIVKLCFSSATPKEKAYAIRQSLIWPFIIMKVFVICYDVIYTEWNRDMNWNGEWNYVVWDPMSLSDAPADPLGAGPR